LALLPGMARATAGLFLIRPTTFRRNQMPVIAWLLGVPLTVVLLLMLLGVF
jgi:hypothetical protein